MYIYIYFSLSVSHGFGKTYLRAPLVNGNIEYLYIEFLWHKGSVQIKSKTNLRSSHNCNMPIEAIFISNVDKLT